VNQLEFHDDPKWASAQDAKDPLARLRGEFQLPPGPPGLPGKDAEELLYFAGHSLGLQPRRARALIEQELESWAQLGVEGHFRGANPWMNYHQLLTGPTARILGALPDEVVVMNTLSVNLHLLMVSFYRPQGKRTRILIEAGAFPSDRYAVDSQARFHGLDPRQTVVEAQSQTDLFRILEEQGDFIALVLIGSVNYLSGEAFDLAAITRAGHARGCVVGFDLAHGAGNLQLRLHDDGPDFAAWCSYKYLNGGPGACGGVFVHERHARADLQRFAGWWGHDQETRFQMGPEFKPMRGAEGWQLSNPPILALAPLRASMELFDAAGIGALREKSVRLTGYLEYLLDSLPGRHFTQVTPREPDRRGTMLTLRVHQNAKALVGKLQARGALCDYRSPDIVRLAPAPLYTRFADVQRLGQLLREALDG